MRVLLKPIGSIVPVGAKSSTDPDGAIPEVLPIDLFVRCFAERKGGQWQACSLEFGLAAQGDSFPEVRRKLESMIASYVLDALTEDRAHARELLSRKAPLGAFARYYLYSALPRILGDSKDSAAYREPLPLAPRLCSV